LHEICFGNCTYDLNSGQIKIEIKDGKLAGAEIVLEEDSTLPIYTKKMRATWIEGAFLFMKELEDGGEYANEKLLKHCYNELKKMLTTTPDRW